MSLRYLLKKGYPYDTTVISLLRYDQISPRDTDISQNPEIYSRGWGSRWPIPSEQQCSDWRDLNLNIKSNLKTVQDDHVNLTSSSTWRPFKVTQSLSPMSQVYF